MLSGYPALGKNTTYQITYIAHVIPFELIRHSHIVTVNSHGH
jgi:hypothetical protein